MDIEQKAAAIAQLEQDGALSAEHEAEVAAMCEADLTFAAALVSARTNLNGGDTVTETENMNESGNWIAAPNDVGCFAYKDQGKAQLVILIGWRGNGGKGSPVLEGHGVSVKTSTRNRALLSLTFDALERQGQRINWKSDSLDNVAAGLQHNIDLSSISVKSRTYSSEEWSQRVEDMVKKVKQKGVQSKLTEIGVELDSIAEQLIEAGVTGPFNGSRNTKVPKSGTKAAFTW